MAEGKSEQGQPDPGKASTPHEPVEDRGARLEAVREKALRAETDPNIVDPGVTVNTNTTSGVVDTAEYISRLEADNDALRELRDQLQARVDELEQIATVSRLAVPQPTDLMEGGLVQVTDQEAGLYFGHWGRIVSIELDEGNREHSIIVVNFGEDNAARPPKAFRPGQVKA